MPLEANARMPEQALPPDENNHSPFEYVNGEMDASDRVPLIGLDTASEEGPLFATDVHSHRASAGELLVQGVAADPVLTGKKVLVVDDDIRNVFAMTSVLEEAGMHVVAAETGQAAIDLLEESPDMDIVLMDIMMPGMDGYETIRAIRTFAAFRPLPIIAVTAKAMPGDREKCLEAGASDYLSKPVVPAELLALLAQWVVR
jgi:CheY-like chemotaxis protein